MRIDRSGAVPWSDAILARRYISCNSPIGKLWLFKKLLDTPAISLTIISNKLAGNGIDMISSCRALPNRAIYMPRLARKLGVSTKPMQRMRETPF